MNKSETMSYFYRPLPFYAGRVLKCAGICTDDNRTWFLAANPDTIVLPQYMGDRIKADTHEPV